VTAVSPDQTVARHGITVFNERDPVSSFPATYADVSGRLSRDVERWQTFGTGQRTCPRDPVYGIAVVVHIKNGHELVEDVLRKLTDLPQRIVCPNL